MVEPTDIEKKSLEAHVELCAERYNALEDKLEVMDTNISTLATLVKEIKEALNRMNEKNNDRLIKWGIGIIAALCGTTGWLIAHYVFK